ncbi:MAG: hypothetical protein EXQ96_07105 [Alphaproteobacteria bacterium]|nr:hypothetical protein [Alphaproteobacteria bacterium]
MSDPKSADTEPADTDKKGRRPDRDRSAAALRANLGRRKTRSRAQAATTPVAPAAESAPSLGPRVLKPDGLE